MRKARSLIWTIIIVALVITATQFAMKNIGVIGSPGTGNSRNVTWPAENIDQQLRALYEESPAPELYGPYEVVRVIDGDTAIILIDQEETRVRFIGIDTPESVNPDENKNTPQGKIASDFTKTLLTGKSVYLEYDLQREDDYGRTLAYLYMDDGVTLVQDEILRAGMATTMTIQPNSKYADHFYDIQVEARESGAGFWGEGFFG